MSQDNIPINYLDLLYIRRDLALKPLAEIYEHNTAEIIRQVLDVVIHGGEIKFVGRTEKRQVRVIGTNV